MILEISSKRLGVTAVTDNGKMLGVVTDGDLRRMLQKTDSITGLYAKDVMTTSPKTITPDELAVNALQLMKQNNITQLIVVEGGKYLGVLHLHDLIREGII